MSLKLVRFVKHDLPYAKGELAAFPLPIAEKLIEKGFAELHDKGEVKPFGRRIPEPKGSGYADPPQAAA